MNRTDSTQAPKLIATLAAATIACGLVYGPTRALAQSSGGDGELRPKLVQLPNGRLALRTERVERRPALTSSLGVPGGGRAGGGSAASTNVADWNGDGEVNSGDHLAFMRDYAAKAPRADLDGDGVWSSSDVLAFQNLFASGQSSNADFPMLQPGSGFAGSTPVPPPVGQSSTPGHSARAIARWNMAPFQTFDGVGYVGVVAFHVNGIDRVEFSLNGGPWLPVSEMRLNPLTQTWEYAASFDASSVGDGRHEVRARIFPRTAGAVRVLQGDINAGSTATSMHSMIVFANAGGSLPNRTVSVSRSGSDATGDGSATKPFRTIDHAIRSTAARPDGSLEGLTIRIESEGDWDIPSTDVIVNERWITVESAPSLSPESVRFVGRGQPRADAFRFSRVTLVPSTSGTLLTRPRDKDRLVWLDRVLVQGQGRNAATRGLFDRHAAFITDSTFADMPNGPTDIVYVRGVTTRRILSDAYSNVSMVVNSSVHDIDPGNSGAHPDVYQVYRPDSPLENVIVYGLEATDIVAQGIFFGGNPPTPHSNIAFANCLIAQRNGSVGSTQIGTSLEHALFINVTLPNQSMLWRTKDVTNSAIYNSCIQKVSVDASKITPEQLAAAVRFDSNHFIDSTSYGSVMLGTDASTGEPRFSSPQSWDFRPVSGSPLLNRGTSIVAGDLDNEVRRNPQAIGAYEGR